MLPPGECTYSVRAAAYAACGRCICLPAVRRQLPAILDHPDPIWNDGVLGFFEDGRPNKKNNNWTITRWVAMKDQFLIQQKYGLDVAVAAIYFAFAQARNRAQFLKW